MSEKKRIGSFYVGLEVYKSWCEIKELLSQIEYNQAVAEKRAERPITNSKVLRFLILNARQSAKDKLERTNILRIRSLRKAGK